MKKTFAMITAMGLAVLMIGTAAFAADTNTEAITNDDGSSESASSQELLVGEDNFVITADVPVSSEGELTVGDHSVIKILESDVAVTEEDIDSYIESIREYAASMDASTGETVLPELTDEFVQQYSAENMDTQLNTVEELREYTREHLYKTKLHNAIYSAIQETEEVITYKEDMYLLIKEYYMSSLQYYANLYLTYGYEYDENDIAALMYGYDSAESFISAQAQYYTKAFMLLDLLAEEVGVEVSQEEVDAFVVDYMEQYDYDTAFDEEEFKEMYGDGWVLISTELNLKFDKVMTALENRVEFE